VVRVDGPHPHGRRGRTELAANAEEGARQLFRTVYRLKELPEYVDVLPGAYAGSVCGRRLSGKPWSTIGFEKRSNQAFKIADEAEFVRFVTAEFPPTPPEAAKIRAANSGITAAAA
jgi:hydroxyacylglutathione hydrolase